MRSILTLSAVNRPRHGRVALFLVAVWVCAGVAQATGAPAKSGPPQSPFMARYRNERFQFNTIESLDLAIRDLMATHNARYPQGAAYLSRLEALKAKGASPGDAELEKLRLEALLANPLLDFDKLVMVKRKYYTGQVEVVPDPLANEARGRAGAGDPPATKGRYKDSWDYGWAEGWNYAWGTQCQDPVKTTGWDNEIAVLSPIRPDGKWTTLYRPSAEQSTALVGYLCLHWDADRLLFSMPEIQNPAYKVKNGKTIPLSQYHVYQIGADGSGLRRLTPHEDAKTGVAEYFDGCYLPNGKIALTSTACMQKVPCSPGFLCAVMHLLDPVSGSVRQLGFDQDHNYYPSVTNDGRIMYLRWEYSDTTHAYGRKVFAMSPDGTRQMPLYGTNSWWPNATWWLRAIPGEMTKFVGVVGGHHSAGHQGELVIFDSARSHHETEGVVQRIPGRNHKIENTIVDGVGQGSWPRFKSPWPLSAKYILASCKFNPDEGTWKLVLADVFDNIVVINDAGDFNLFEPLPLRKTPMPPVIPEAVDLNRRDAVVYVQDVYQGNGLKNVPRGTIKKLRITSLFYPEQPYSGGGAWTARRILGTVPVRADGSALFRIPANVNVALYPLDAEDRAVQLMRSWFTGMPGEFVSCVGCHEGAHQTPRSVQTEALSHAPLDIEPWFGPARGFSFGREIQPIVDKYCAGCHDGKGDRNAPLLSATVSQEKGPPKGVAFGVLSKYTRVPRKEGDLHLLMPYEFYADNTELIQLLKKGHYGVQLDKESWERLYTWIDLNVPGTFPEDAGRYSTYMRYRKTCANLDDNPFAMPPRPIPVSYVPPPPAADSPASALACPGWPFSAEEAARRQKALGQSSQRSIDLGSGITLDLCAIPAGEFIMGSTTETPVERPRQVVKVRRPFWMGSCAISNKQFALFDPEHDSGMITDHLSNGRQYYVSGADQPVVRVTWKQALAYCEWLSRKTGQRVTLPTEAQWEWACRAGTDSAFWYGDINAEFGPFANFADKSLERLFDRDSRVMSDARRDDKFVVSGPIDAFKFNSWGLRSMHGNVAQWTLSDYKAYPYIDDDGRNQGKAEGMKVARGGSWYDRPYRGTSSYRLGYRADQPVFNVGFRVVCEMSAP